MPQHTRALPLLLSAIALVASSPALAGKQETLAELAAAKITLVQAVAAAEQHLPGGRAVQADLDTQQGKTVFEVDVVASDNQIHEVVVDATSGAVLHSKVDKP